MIKLNILDQSPIFESQTPEEAVLQTIELVQFAEENKFHRFWFSEHHNTNSFASASPEIMISVAAASTKRIKLGSAGVLLAHYSPLKSLNNFIY
jgi:alkanesulfonate monooxygenase SsuD/methylene tetrahydromethanopterin reductase-like flavin-dependent oxidoreductase (luciferase family)